MLPSHLLLLFLTLCTQTLAFSTAGFVTFLSWYSYRGATDLDDVARSCHGQWHQQRFHCGIQTARIVSGHVVAYLLGSEGPGILETLRHRRGSRAVPRGQSAKVMETRIRDLDLVGKARVMEAQAAAAPDGVCMSSRREVEQMMDYSRAAYACPAEGFRYGDGWFSYTDGFEVKLWCTALCRADRSGCYDFGRRIGHDVKTMTNNYGMTGSFIWWNEIGTAEVAKCRVVRLKPPF